MRTSYQLTRQKKRDIIRLYFHKLKEAKFWTEEQTKQIFLGELEEDFWKEKKPNAVGTTLPYRYRPEIGKKGIK